MDMGMVGMDGWFWSTVGRGLIIGLVLAVPVGPIGMLCIVRTLRFGRIAGLATGLGAATADALYAAIAAFGLATLTATLVSAQKPLAIIGAIALGIIGVRTIRAATPTATADPTRSTPDTAASPRMLYLGTIALTLANPATIITFVGIFAGITAGGSRPALETATLVLAVFLGSTLWWLVLSGTVAAVRGRWLSGEGFHPDPARMHRLNLASGLVLIGFGIVAAVRALS